MLEACENIFIFRFLCSLTMCMYYLIDRSGWGDELFRVGVQSARSNISGSNNEYTAIEHTIVSIALYGHL